MVFLEREVFLFALMRVPVLKNKLVVMRPPRLADAPNYCRWLANPEVTRFLQRHEDPPTLREERQFLRERLRLSDVVFWTITTSNGEHIGCISLAMINREHRRAVFGIFIGEPKYWGQGYGTAAGRLVINYGFRRLRLHRIYLHVYAYNIPGVKSYRKLGFQMEGRLRDHLYRGRYFHDILVMGLLRSEFLRPNHNVKFYGKRKKQ